MSKTIGTRTFLAFVLTFLAASTTAHAEPRCVKNVCLPAVQSIGATAVPMLGMTLFKYYLFKVYTIALYGPPGIRSIKEIQQDVPKQLTLHYHRDFSAEDFAKGADEILGKNPEFNRAAFEDRIAAINKLYQPVKEGDEYTLRYEPGKGTSLLLNGELKGTIPGADFGKFYLGIWLSEHCISDSMRDALLEGE